MNICSHHYDITPDMKPVAVENIYYSLSASCDGTTVLAPNEIVHSSDLRYIGIYNAGGGRTFIQHSPFTTDYLAYYSAADIKNNTVAKMVYALVQAGVQEDWGKSAPSRYNRINSINYIKQINVGDYVQILEDNRMERLNKVADELDLSTATMINQLFEESYAATDELQINNSGIAKHLYQVMGVYLYPDSKYPNVPFLTLRDIETDEVYIDFIPACIVTYVASQKMPLLNYEGVFIGERVIGNNNKVDGIIDINNKEGTVFSINPNNNCITVAFDDAITYEGREVSIPKRIRLQKDGVVKRKLVHLLFCRYTNLDIDILEYLNNPLREWKKANTVDYTTQRPLVNAPDVVNKQCKIKTWDELVAEYGVNRFGEIKLPTRFTPAMAELCDKKCRVTSLYNYHITLTDWEDESANTLANDCIFSVEMIKVLNANGEFVNPTVLNTTTSDEVYNSNSINEFITKNARLIPSNLGKISRGEVINKTALVLKTDANEVQFLHTVPQPCGVSSYECNYINVNDFINHATYVLNRYDLYSSHIGCNYSWANRSKLLEQEIKIAISRNWLDSHPAEVGVINTSIGVITKSILSDNADIIVPILESQPDWAICCWDLETNHPSSMDFCSEERNIPMNIVTNTITQGMYRRVMDFRRILCSPTMFTFALPSGDDMFVPWNKI